ncbi:AAA family ATPase [Kordiimonas marina]|uniref:AAA family ATPase n=1 Tax=Kordiimonas marina TaxID=2872312 RepID=UPI001FF501E8|nr:AAA family ATPase [Kordiimonas marina]MCJ9429664.1 AAA family ATPase [Kordiimonas marina]
MRLAFIEIQNFRKLKSVRIDIAEQSTLLVGANNSGKTSAMDAMGHFLTRENQFRPDDFTLSNWPLIEAIAEKWEAEQGQPDPAPVTLQEWEPLLPSMDVWLDIETNEVHYVSHLIPKLSWRGGKLGVRLRFEPNVEHLRREYLKARNTAKDTKNKGGETAKDVLLWPQSMRDFLDKQSNLKMFFSIVSYTLDPGKLQKPTDNSAIPQKLPESAVQITSDPLKGLMRVNHINAQRGFKDQSHKEDKEDSDGGTDGRRLKKLSAQLRSYYNKHINPSEAPEPSDLAAIMSLQKAQNAFSESLEKDFTKVLGEMADLGFPGMTDPKIRFLAKVAPVDALNHPAAVQYELPTNDKSAGDIPLHLPEDYNGLGYQNLISMAFRLMSFRDQWMMVGKAGKEVQAEPTDELSFPPLHVVLVEEPEAHLHAQVQQVFMRKAYDILRNHEDLGEGSSLQTQLVISTHSSHIAHEANFSDLRYFRRVPASNKAHNIPTSTVVNMSGVFDDRKKVARFASRYLKASHCDLFFADALIIVEGAAERMLLPHFIKEQHPELHKRYISILELGGRHAHRLRRLIQHMQLTTLIISDLDSVGADGKKAPPARGAGMKTGNPTLAKWMPGKNDLDHLLDLPSSDKTKEYAAGFLVRSAYQTPVMCKLTEGAGEKEVLAYTFEDALIYENIEKFRTLKGTGLIRKARDTISTTPDAADLSSKIQEILKTGNKAEFALDLLYDSDPKVLKVPGYIDEGLTWLTHLVSANTAEVLPQPDADNVLEEAVA